MPTTKETVLNLRAEGLSYSEIAARLGRTSCVVRTALRPDKATRNLAVEKASGYCEKCSEFVGNSGSVHHKDIDRIKGYNDPENLMLLCRPCHKKIHFDGYLNESRLPSFLTEWDKYVLFGPKCLSFKEFTVGGKLTVEAREIIAAHADYYGVCKSTALEILVREIRELRRSEKK